VHPLAAGSPFFSSLPLQQYGLEWIHSPAPLAHPLDDGTAVVLERDLRQAEVALGRDGGSWRRLLDPMVEHWRDFISDVLAPQPRIPSHPVLMAKFGVTALLSARSTGTSLRGLYICSASTPPGGGVHGMCGYHAAKRALKDIFNKKVQLKT